MMTQQPTLQPIPLRLCLGCNGRRQVPTFFGTTMRCPRCDAGPPRLAYAPPPYARPLGQ